jgi:hypothetical protein
VNVRVGVSVAVAVGVSVAVDVSVAVGVADGVSVGSGVGVSDGIERVGTTGPRRVGGVFPLDVQPAKISARDRRHANRSSQKRT